MGIRRHVVGGLFMGGADGFAPGVSVVGVDVFVLGEVQSLDCNGEKQVPRCSRDDTARWRPSAKVKEHKEEPSLERLVDMEVSRNKIRFGIFGGASRRRGALLNGKSLAKR